MKRIVSSLVILVLLVGAMVLGCTAPAAFSILNLTIQPAEVAPNETVNISMSVSNTGGTQGDYNVVLNIDGLQEEAKSVNIAAGASVTVTFSVTKETAGSYSVVVNGLTGSFTVVQEVAFFDPELEAAIRLAINKPQGPIYTSDLESISELIAQVGSISDLRGLEHCVNLQKLDLSSNNISNISPLEGLTTLQELYLTQNDISDISPLAGLTNIQNLDLNRNNITDISPLAGVVSLQLLSLWNNNIADFSPLESLINLRHLNLIGTGVGDISALGGLTNLQELLLRTNTISDISPLVALTNLQLLDLRENNISNISWLVENNGLSEGETVYLGNNPLSSTSIGVYIPQLIERGVDVSWTAPSLDIGKPAPEFQLQDLNGNTVSLSDFRGSPVLLNFWATWCGPCHSEMPFIQEIYEEWQDKGLIILTVNRRQTSSEVQQFIQDDNLSIIVLLDTNGYVADLYSSIEYIPATFFIDEEGITRQIEFGAFSSKAEIEDCLSKIIS